MRVFNLKRTWNTIVVLLVLTFGQQLSYAQNRHKIDSLRIAYDYSENPMERVYIQIKIADAYYSLRSTDTSIFEYRKAIGIIPPDSLELKGKTLERLSFAYRQKEDMKGMLNTQLLTRDLYEKAHVKPYLMARSCQLLGRTYYEMGVYDSAMVYYMDAKKLYEENDIVHEDYGYLLHFIGSVFKRQDDYEMACEYYEQEIEYGRKHNLKLVEVEGLSLSGLCIEDPYELLKIDLECLRIYQELNKGMSMGITLTYLAEDYLKLDMEDSAMYYYEKAIETYEKEGEISLLGATLSDYALMLIDLGKFALAEKNLKRAEELAAKTGIKQQIRYWTLYGAYFNLRYEQGRYKEAVDYQKLMFAYRDSSRNQEHQDAILEMEVKYNDEKQKAQLAILAKDNELAKKENLLAKEEAETQSFIKKIFMVGGFIVLLLGVFVFIKYRESQKQKLIISEQKSEMEFQKDLVDAKNKDIIDSMVYASSIQKAIITSEEYISKMFPDFFVFYQPRDIVSGDFYWAYEAESGKKLIAIGDCTGHGVPGAMMSMLGTAFLNEIVIEKKIETPADIMNSLREQVKRSLKGDQRKDGMDMCFCTVEGNTLTFCGANLPLYIFRNGEFIQLKGEKQPIGYVPTGEQPFTDQTFELSKGDVIYMFSDGYADQFGGPKGKKYKYKSFREKLADISMLPISKQKEIIDEEFEIWKGDLEQLDDVCVMGIKI
ncbi:MAG: SpoIIE family protein phosphatase [Crocinitomicaceae bacterium]|nr:SpoIIE family protein phosphatase [Crocinitomicaceae bacterium]